MAVCELAAARAVLDLELRDRPRRVILSPIQSANDSLSQRSSHHSIVTRSPNHMCASSCAVTIDEQRARWDALAAAGSSSRTGRANVIAPGFSIAPGQNSGTAIRSSFS